MSWPPPVLSAGYTGTDSSQAVDHASMHNAERTAINDTVAELVDFELLYMRPASADPGSPSQAGVFYFNTVLHRPRFWDGDEWITIPKIVGATVAPSGPSTGDVWIDIS